MMGGSCSIHRRPSRATPTSLSAPNDRRRRTFRYSSISTRLGRFCGAHEDDSCDSNTHCSEKEPVKRAARHSVDAEVPNHFISHFYPIDDNYIPHANGRRSPKSLTDLCIDAICRSLPDLDGELPPGLPQDIVDQILHSLTSHAALNSTTLRTLSRCELGTLSLANCRGVTDEWLIPLGNTPTSSVRSLSPVATNSDNPSSHGTQSNRDSNRQRCHLPTQVLLLPCQSPNFLEKESSPDGIDNMEDSTSSSTASFVSAHSTTHNNTYSGKSSDVVEKQSVSPPLPTLLSPPDFSKKVLPLRSSPREMSFSSLPPASPLPFDMPQMDETLPSFPSKTNYETVRQDSYSTIHGGTSTLTRLDLRGSQRLTDRGLLQLSRTPLSSLEIVKLDNCHCITGRGLLAFSRSHKLHTLSLANCRRITDEAVVNVSHLGRSIMAMNLGGCRCLTDRSLEGLAGLINLRKLDLSQCDLITNEGLVNLQELEQIDELSLGWCRQISDDGLSILAKQPNRSQFLRVLRLARCPITDNGLEYISMFSSLEELDLNGCINLSSAALGNTLQKLMQLSSLDVSYCPGILRSSWQGKINALKSLELCYSGVKDSHISHLRDLPMLEELNLDSCPIGDWTMAHLADNNVIPNITSLNLADTEISDIGMSKIAQFQKMKQLSLFYCNVSNAGLRHLVSLTNLEILNLDSREIGDEGLKFLRGLPLKSLDVFSGRVSDLGCAHISNIKTLTSLELCGGGIGDMGCTHLATLSNLTSLNLSQNLRITNRGAATLAALTNLKALNLSNTRVTPDALLFLSGLMKLQSLALYGCKNMVDSPRLNALPGELPSLRCLRLNSASDEDGVITHFDSEEESSDMEEEEDVASYQEGLLQDDPLLDDNESMESSDMEEFEDAHHEEMDSMRDSESHESEEEDSDEMGDNVESSDEEPEWNRLHGMDDSDIRVDAEEDDLETLSDDMIEFITGKLPRRL